MKSETLTIGSPPYKRSYEYDSAGNLVKKIDRNGRITRFGYDNLNRPITEQWFTAGDVATGYAAKSHYYADGRLKEASDAASAYEFQYDAIGRTDYVDQALSPLPNNSFTYDYVYDKVGRLAGQSYF